MSEASEALREFFKQQNLEGLEKKYRSVGWCFFGGQFVLQEIFKNSVFFQAQRSFAGYRVWDNCFKRVVKKKKIQFGKGVGDEDRFNFPKDVTFKNSNEVFTFEFCSAACCYNLIDVF
ncbi:MAG: hypothetical protein HC859_03770 [Bacteroidia bacterium]|nr:hypothetical protein [Bacteroidia bacterium]